MHPVRLRVETVAPRALEWLGRAGPRRVLGVHRDVLYLEHSGGLLALTTADVPLSPLSARLGADGGLPAAAIGDDATHWILDTTEARLWAAQPEWPALDLGTLLRELSAVRVPAEARLRAEAPDVIAAGLSAALPVTLLGLGPGLTPAGDDVLVGRLFAARAGLIALAEAQVADLLARAATRTTRLSQAFLQSAAAGECGQTWQDLWPTPSRPAGESRFHAIRVILRSGQTSGAAALWGFLTATEANTNHAPNRHDSGFSDGRRPLDPGQPA